MLSFVLFMKNNLLLPLNLPPYPFKISEKQGQLSMFDFIRKRNVVITPEEWVRQHFVQYLINQKHYPKGLIKLEGGHKLFGKNKRSDIVVYNPLGLKILLVECKAPNVTIGQTAIDQAARYNIIHKAGLLAVTNGINSCYYSIDFETAGYHSIAELPDYEFKPGPGHTVDFELSP